MRRSRDEPPSDSHAPTREEMMKGFAVWRAGQATPVQSPLRRPRRSLWAIITGRRPADPYVMDDARVQAVIAEVRDTHPRFELDDALPAPKVLTLSDDDDAAEADPKAEDALRRRRARRG